MPMFTFQVTNIREEKITPSIDGKVYNSTLKALIITLKELPYQNILNIRPSLESNVVWFSELGANLEFNRSFGEAKKPYPFEQRSNVK